MLRWSGCGQGLLNLIFFSKISQNFFFLVPGVAQGGGGWVNLWGYLSSDRWASFTRKNSGLKKTKRPTSVVESYKTTYGHKVVVLMSVVEGRAENICSP